MKRRHKRMRLWAGLALLLAIGVVGLRWGVDAIERAFHPKEYSEYVEYYAGKYDLDPLLVYSFICTESDFEPTAQSSVDARGLMQITEETFDWLKSRIAPTETLEFASLYDPEVGMFPRRQRPTTAAGAPWISCWKARNTARTVPR